MFFVSTCGLSPNLFHTPHPMSLGPLSNELEQDKHKEKVSTAPAPFGPLSQGGKCQGRLPALQKKKKADLQKYLNLICCTNGNLFFSRLDAEVFFSMFII